MTTRPTDERTYSVAATWSTVYTDLKGGDWDEDVKEVADGKGDGTARAALTLKYVYDMMSPICGVDPEDGVLAVLKATQVWRSSLYISPADMATMADNFACHYESFDEPLQDHLDDYYSKLPARYLSDEGRREMKDSICHSSEIWLDDATLGGVWVFNNPDHQR